MSKGQGKPRSIPQSNIPIIGEKDKNRDVALVNTILAQIDPVMQRILEGIDGLERRVATVEEVKQVFPSNVRVVIVHDHGTGAKEVQEDPKNPTFESVKIIGKGLPERATKKEKK